MICAPQTQTGFGLVYAFTRAVDFRFCASPFSCKFSSIYPLGAYSDFGAKESQGFTLRHAIR